MSYSAKQLLDNANDPSFHSIDHCSSKNQSELQQKPPEFSNLSSKLATSPQAAIQANNLSSPAIRRIQSPAGLHKLPSGSILAYDLYGSEEGFPLVFFHDSGSSRLEAQFIDESARIQGFRIISVDRPGVGRSDFHNLKSPKQHCEEVLDLLHALGINEFGLIGLGAGGVYSLNLAHQQPKKVRFQVCLAGVSGFVFNERAKHSALTKLWSRVCPSLLAATFRIKEKFFPVDNEQALLELYDQLSYVDRKTLQNPMVREALSLDSNEATRFGPAGVAQDIANSFKRLTFKLNSVSVPTSVWQGDADRLSDRFDCEYMVSNMPRAKFHRLAKGGHFFFIHEMDTVLRQARHDYLKLS